MLYFCGGIFFASFPINEIILKNVYIFQKHHKIQIFQSILLFHWKVIYNKCVYFIFEKFDLRSSKRVNKTFMETLLLKYYNDKLVTVKQYNIDSLLLRY